MNNSKMYVVELEKNVWLAPWTGDPGRTCIEANAKRYTTMRGAAIALGIARRYRAFKDAEIVSIDFIVGW